MKFKALFLSTLAVAALAACTKENNVTTPTDEEDTNFAYLTLNVVPTTAATRADEGPSTNNGTEAESNVSSISVITFNDVYQKLGVVDTLSSLSGTIKVSSLTTKILVVINPDDAVSSAISSASTFSDFNAAITEEIGNITADNNFLMVSSGVVPGDHGLTDVSVYSTISAA
jgi:hypothetical protein